MDFDQYNPDESAAFKFFKRRRHIHRALDRCARNHPGKHTGAGSNLCRTWICGARRYARFSGGNRRLKTHRRTNMAIVPDIAEWDWDEYDEIWGFDD
eukprot:5775609-Heterocapsa_arctica.AAC.1